MKRYQIAAVVLAAFLFPVLSWAAAASPLPGKGVEDLIRTRAWEPALSALSEAIEQSPQQAELYLSRGYVYYRQGRYLSAFMNFNRAAELDPESPAAWNGRGAARAMAGEVEPAVKDFDKALSLAPAYLPALVNLGNTAAARGAYDRAAALYQRGMAADAGDPLVFYNTGVVYLKTGQAKEAVAILEKAVQADPDHAPSFRVRGLALLETGRQDEALTHFDRALELAPGMDEALISRALLQLRHGDCKAAAADLEAGMAVPFIYRIDYGRMAMAVAPPAKAPGAAGTAVSTGKAYPALDAVCDGGKAYYERGVAAFDRGEFQMALMDFNNAILQNPGHGKAFRHRGQVYQKLGNEDQARMDFEQADRLGTEVIFDRECCLRKTLHFLPCGI